MRNAPAILVTILVATIVAIAACKDRDVERMEAVKREVCACKDAACADQAMAHVATGSAGSIKSNQRTQALARDMVECRARLEAADRPSTDPDAEGSDQPADDQAGDRGGASGATGSAGSAGLPDRAR